MLFTDATSQRFALRKIVILSEFAGGERVEGPAVALAFALPACTGRGGRLLSHGLKSLLPVVLTPPQSPRVGLVAGSLTLTRWGPNHDESQRVSFDRSCHAVAGFVPPRRPNRRRRPRS